MPSPYELARSAARARQGRLTVQQALLIQKALSTYADKIAAALRSIGRAGTQDLVSTERLIRAESQRLGEAIRKSVESGRSLSFESTLEVWERAGVDYAQARGVSSDDLSRLHVAPVTVMGAFEQIGGPYSWKTLLSKYAGNAGSEVMEIVRQGLIQDIGEEELARRLRKYVVGSEPFEKLFTNVPTRGGDTAKLDLRKIPPLQRRAAQQMVFNSRRIAFSELHNARAEAEVQHFIADPLIEVVQWTLSPNRGESWTPPDECDLLAEADFFNLGPGRYPVNAVPAPPHPFDRCERKPVTRPVTALGQPKPMPGMARDPRDARAVKFPRSNQLTAHAAEKARQSAYSAILSGQGGL